MPAMLPVADILIITRLMCKCGSCYTSPQPVLHRLYKATSDGPDKTELRVLKAEPALKQDMNDLTPLDKRAIRVVDQPIDWCSCCFAASHSWAEVRDTRPKPILHETTFNAMQAAFHKATKPVIKKGKEVRPKITLDQLFALTGL